MKIFILSRNSNLYSTSRIVEAGRERGHMVRVIDYMRCFMNITAKKPTVYYGGESLQKADAIIQAATEVSEGKLDDHFPLVVW